MKEAGLLSGFLALLALLCVGDLISGSFGLPVPGAVLAMGLAVLLCMVRPAIAERLEPAATLLIRHLSLLFVPAGVGVVAIAAQLSGEWLAVLVTLVLSTFASIVVTALVARALSRRTAARDEGSR